MDKIQKVLIKLGYRDLAQEYYEKTSAVVVDKKNIKALKGKLPKEVQKRINEADSVLRKGYELEGYKNKKLIWMADGHFDSRKFEINNFSSSYGKQLNWSAALGLS